MRWLGLALLTTVALACGVDRDLSEERFACTNGGACGAEPDAGPGPWAACAGPYTGAIASGPDPGTIEGTLSDAGRFDLVVVTSAFPLGRSVVAEVDEGGAVRAVTAGVEMSGAFEGGTCAGTGPWAAEGDTGTWSLERAS